MSKPASSPDFLLMGAITGAHGIRGEVKIRSFTADPLAIADYLPLCSADGSRIFPITFTGGTAHSLLARIDGVHDRNAAEALRGTELFAPRDRLPTPDAEEFYHEDLVGLALCKPGGEIIGEVLSVQNYGAGDLLELRFANGMTELFAFTRQTFPEISLSQRRLTFVPPQIIEG